MSFTTLLRGAAATLALATVPALAADSELLVFDYSGFEDPEFHPDYIEKHGDSPTFAFFGDEDEAFQKLRSGFRSDVTHICAGSVTKWEASDMLEPWDLSRIPAWPDLNKDLTGANLGGDAEVYFVPTDYGSTAISYNTEQVPAEDVASLQVFQNPKYAGRMSIPDNVDDAFALAYLATGTTNWQNATDAQFEAATAWLRATHENLRTYWTDPAEIAQLLASGEVLVAWTWNETLPTMVEMGMPIGFQREAAEGSSLWLCGYVNMKEGQGSEDKAYDFLNAFLSPTATMALLGAGYGQSNAAAQADLDPQILVDAGLGPVTAPVLAQLPMDADLRQKQSEAFERIKAGF